MGKRKLAFWIAWLFVLCVRGQKVQVTGIVIDTAGQTLAFAHLMFTPADSTQSVRYFTTDKNGIYRLYLPEGNYRVKVSYLGYKIKSFDWNIKGEKAFKKIVLLPESEVLDEVAIVYRKPVRIKEDSIIYVADSFRTGREWKLKELMKNMPGIEISREGEIRVAGKKVSKVMVEGKPFFGGNPKLALDNIPADAVDSVEALENYRDVSFMSGLEDEARTVINIKLKKGKKSFFFGDIKGATGLPERYMLKPNVYHYAPDMQTGFIGYAGNTEDNPLTFKDLLFFQTLQFSESNLQRELKTFKTLSGLIQGNFRKKNTRSATGQWHWDKAKHALSLTAFAISRNALKHSAQEVFRTSTGYKEYSESEETEQHKAFLLKFHWRVKHNVWSYFDLFQLTSADTQNNHRTEKITAGSFPYEINENRQETRLTSETLALWYKKISRKLILRAEAHLKMNRNGANNNFNTDSPLSNLLIPPLYFGRIDSLQRQETAYGLQLKFYYLITNRLHLYLTEAIRFNDAVFDTAGLIDTTGNNNWENLSAYGFYNFIRSRFLILQNNLHLKYSVNRLSIKLGAGAVRWQNEANDKIYFFPFLLLKKKFPGHKDLSLKLDGTLTPLDISDLAPGYYFTGLRMIRSGNDTLFPTPAYRLSLSFRDFNLSRKYELFTRLFYRYQPHTIARQIDYNGMNITEKFYLDRNSSWNVSFRTSFKYYFSSVFAGLLYQVTLRRFNNKINGNEISQTDRQNIWQLSLGSLKWKYWDWQVRFGPNQIVLHNFYGTQTAWQYNLHTNWSLSFSEYMQMGLDYGLNLSGKYPPYHSLNVQWNFNSVNRKWRYFITGRNILGDVQKNFSFDNDAYYENHIAVMPAYWMAGVVRKL